MTRSCVTLDDALWDEQENELSSPVFSHLTANTYNFKAALLR